MCPGLFDVCVIAINRVNRRSPGRENNRTGKDRKMKSILLPLLFMAGCSMTPYVELGAAYQFNRPEGELCKNGKCQSPTKHFAKVELGVKYKFKGGSIRAAYCHSSEILRGWPSNDLAEAYSDEFCVSFHQELKWPSFH